MYSTALRNTRAMPVHLISRYKGKRRAMEASDPLHFFDRYERFGAPEDIRSRHRYEAIVSCNSELFRGARVLNLYSGDGRWCMAALDAGATHVTGVDPSRKAADAARTTFIEYGVAPQAYRIRRFGYQWRHYGQCSRARSIWSCVRGRSSCLIRVSSSASIYRLKAKHVILDTT